MREAEARTIISLVDMDQRKAGYFQMREREIMQELRDWEDNLYNGDCQVAWVVVRGQQQLF